MRTRPSRWKTCEERLSARDGCACELCTTKRKLENDRKRIKEQAQRATQQNVPLRWRCWVCNRLNYVELCCCGTTQTIVDRPLPALAEEPHD